MDRYEFAKNAVTETQFDYTSKQRWVAELQIEFPFRQRLRAVTSLTMENSSDFPFAFDWRDMDFGDADLPKPIDGETEKPGILRAGRYPLPQDLLGRQGYCSVVDRRTQQLFFRVTGEVNGLVDV